MPPIYDTGRTADSGYWVYDYAAMGTVVDRIRIMAYDYSVGEPGPIAPLDWVRRRSCAAKQRRRRRHASSCSAWVSTAATGWSPPTGTCPASAEGTTPVTQQSVTELIAKRNAVPVHDPVTGEASFTYQLQVTDGTATCTQTPRGALHRRRRVPSHRIDLAREERIGGVALWALGFDSEATVDRRRHSERHLIRSRSQE